MVGPPLSQISTGNSLGDAVEALGTASNATRQRHGHDTPNGWPGIVALTNGRLLARRWT